MARRINGRGSRLACVRGPGEGVGVDGGVEQHLERSSVLDAELAVFLDVDLGEERLVAQSAVRVVAAGVDVGAVSQETEGVIQVGACVGVFTVVGVESTVHQVKLSADPVLLALEHGQRDRVGVVGLHESVLLVLQPVAVGGELAELVGFGEHETVELVVQHPGQRLPAARCDLHALVVVLDQVLDVLDEDGLPGAVGSLGVPAGAHEVGVDVALVVLRVVHDESRAAGSAVDRAFQVVVVHLGRLGRALVRGEDGLHLIPDLGRNERVVRALVGDAAVDHVALVVRVRQEPVHRGHRERLGRVLRRRQTQQAARGQLVVELADRPAPGSVCLVGPLDQRRPVRVELHGAYLAAQLVTDTDVEIADGRLGRRAASGRLLRHALDDLGGEVAGVELRDRGHDAVQQHPTRGLVDVLRGRDEHDPGLLEREVNGHVVGTVAGEPVDLVDDAVRDAIALDVLDHAHEVGAVCLAGGLACVDELLDDDGAELFGLPAVGFPLGGDREPLLGAALLGLLLGRYAQVGHRKGGALGRVDETAHRIGGAHERGSHLWPSLTGIGPRARACTSEGC
ncbi:hypothetical protein GCM10025864_26840 [Luteimicrobium album]|uniref:Uncharacterized protein n=1 Tax=Luteimicrobium album TaxID=1054550 RepID=A0ABQ6I2C7_9MICO|nr:hypothetical protein GCM10025864_26840 [Luteimicrobium album]